MSPMQRKIQYFGNSYEDLSKVHMIHLLTSESRALFVLISLPVIVFSSAHLNFLCWGLENCKNCCLICGKATQCCKISNVSDLLYMASSIIMLIHSTNI